MKVDAGSSLVRLRHALERIAAAVRAREAPLVDPEDVPCFTATALRGDPNVTRESLSGVLATLTDADLPVLQRAIEAIDTGERAWLGFKIVTDPSIATDSEDTDVVGYRGKDQGSADACSGVFVVVDPSGVREEAELLFSREYSERDHLQMLDVTRGPAMHDEQYAGIAWKAAPLFRRSRLFLMGAGTVAAEVERVATMVDFETTVVDYDPAYLNAERFPLSTRVLIESFDAIPDLGITPDDYVCVLTRGHMFDPQALIYGIRSGAGYVGMMGHPKKNARVFELAETMGIDRASLEATHTPIGIRFGARTPTELAMSVVAELIQVRDDLRQVTAHAHT